MRYLITGASSGIGKKCAERLLDAGHTCVLVARNKEKLEAIASKHKESTYIVTVDLQKIESIESIFLMLRTNGILPLDGMIHCAGVAPLKRIDENDVKTVMDTYACNVFSFIELMRHFTQKGFCTDGASVVSMGSVVSKRGSNRQSIYSGTKAALEATSRCMAKELIDRKIRVNTIISGTVETEMLQELRKESMNLDEKITKTYPLGIIEKEEICEMIEFLLSDKSSHITGASIPIDSGYLL